MTQPTPPSSEPTLHPEQPIAGSELITLGGGCFWCTEAVFTQVEGVLAVQSGYSNGQRPADRAPSYEEVCTGETGYVEVIRVRFDPECLPLKALLEIFFAVHDPTTLNRQGNDVGTQYRSGIYTQTPAQAEVARALIDELTPGFGQPIVTEVQPEARYWPAEDYHQRYFDAHPHQGYCAFVVAPKVAKLHKVFTQRLRKPA